MQPITENNLPMLRAQVRQRLLRAGLSGTTADRFMLAIHEAAANAQEHAGGGRLWLWRHLDDLWCEITDDGPGLPDPFTVRTGPPHPDDVEHVGLWLIHRACPDVQISNTPRGLRLLLRQPLAPQRAADPPAGG